MLQLEVNSICGILINCFDVWWGHEIHSIKERYTTIPAMNEIIFIGLTQALLQNQPFVFLLCLSIVAIANEATVKEEKLRVLLVAEIL